MAKTNLSPHNGIFYDTREFLEAVSTGQIDRMSMEYMLKDKIDLEGDYSGISDEEYAVAIIRETASDTELRDLFDKAVEKMEAEQEAKKDPGEPHFFILMKYKDRKDLQYLTHDGELNPSDGDYFTQEELQRVWPTLILENLERIDILR